MKTLSTVTAITCMIIAAACSTDGGGADPTIEPDPAMPVGVDIERDALGTVHVYGDTQAAAFYGLGWATARDRLFQMDEHRRFMRGRMSESYAGSGDAENDNELLEHDVRMRTLGFHRHADKVLAHPDFPAETLALINAYVKGVNAWVASDDFTLPPAFATAGVEGFEPWTAVDTLLVWERIRERFNADSSQSEINQMTACEAGSCFQMGCQPPVDDAAAVVPEATSWPPMDETACHQPAPRYGVPIEFKASHGWVVRGDRTTTGKPVMAVDPKLLLTAPSFWQAFHVSWPGTSVRGIGLAGAPGYLVFYNEHVSQTLTAGGGDISDVFELTPSGTGYVVDGVTKEYVTHEETIAIKGGAPLSLQVKESDFGPVISDLVAAPAGRVFALRHIDLLYPDTHGLVGAIAIMSATDKKSYLAGFDKWLSPGANAIFATDEGEYGSIGYLIAGAIGKRAPNLVEGVDLGGRHPFDGSTTANDWSGYLSVNERPHVFDPAQGYLFTANHLPVGSWFDDYAYTGAKVVGDTLRSLRLRYIFAELLPNADSKLSPEQIHAVHYDAKHDGIRLYGNMLRFLVGDGTLPAVTAGATAVTTQEKAAKVLMAIDVFEAQGAEVRISNPIYPLADKILTDLPFQMRYDKNPAIFCKFNAAEGGYSFLMKTFDADPAGTMGDSDVRAFVIGEAAKMWDELIADGADQDPNEWRAPQQTPKLTFMYQANQHCPTAAQGNCSLDPSLDQQVPIDGAHGATIISSLGSSGTGTIDHAAIQTSTQLVPYGVTEDPGSPHFASGVAELIAGDTGDQSAIPVAPLDRALIEALDTINLVYAE